MEKKVVVETVLKLIQLNIDVAAAYDQALDEIDDAIMRSRLIDFQKAHRRHAEELSNSMRTLGVAPPKAAKDFKGFFMEAFAAVSGFAGMKGALKALKTTEKIAAQFYSEIVSEDLPAEIKEFVRSHFTDERIHLDYIDSNLEALR